MSRNDTAQLPETLVTNNEMLMSNMTPAAMNATPAISIFFFFVSISFCMCSEEYPVASSPDIARLNLNCCIQSIERNIPRKRERFPVYLGNLLGRWIWRLNYLTIPRTSIRFLKSKPFVLYFPSNSREGGSEQIREGAQISKKPLTDNAERFLSMLRFDSREN